jgi:hypothetical protein
MRGVLSRVERVYRVCRNLLLFPDACRIFLRISVADQDPSGLEKTRVFKKKKNQPSGFFWVFLGFFWFFWVFGVFWVFLGLFARTRGFLGFISVSRILLGASRL